MSEKKKKRSGRGNPGRSNPYGDRPGSDKPGGGRERMEIRPPVQSREKRNRGASPERYDRGQAESFEKEGLLIGRNPVIEALKSGRRIDRILILKDAEGSVRKIIGMAREKGIIISYAERSTLDRVTGGAPHQGVAAYASDFEYCEPEDILNAATEKGEPPFIVVLDGIEDPHNLGAIMRTADAAGAHGVIIPKRRSCDGHCRGGEILRRSVGLYTGRQSFQYRADASVSEEGRRVDGGRRYGRSILYTDGSQRCDRFSDRR